MVRFTFGCHSFPHTCASTAMVVACPICFEESHLATFWNLAGSETPCWPCTHSAFIISSAYILASPSSCSYINVYTYICTLHIRLGKMSSCTFRENLTAMNPSILRDWIMSIQLPANYMGICANMPELTAILNQQALTRPIRHYALQHFVYVASHLSRAQIVDLLQDAQLPWEEQSVCPPRCARVGDRKQ